MNLIGPAPTKDIEQGKRDLDEFGYCIHEDLLYEAQIEATKARLLEQAELEEEQGVAWLGNGGRGGNTWVGRYRNGQVAPKHSVRTLLNKGRIFIDIATHPIVLAYMRHAFLGKDFILCSATGGIMRTDSIAQAIHIDQIAIPFPTPIPVLVNTIFCISDFEATRGATRVVPRSHLGPPPPIDLDPDTKDMINPKPIETIPAEAKAGSVIVFDGRLWHGGGAFTSGTEVRYSLTMPYTLPFYRQQDCYPASLHDCVYESLSDAERALFGFKTGGPAGRIDPRSPGDRTNVDLKAPYVPELRRGSDKRAIPVEQVQQFPSLDLSHFRKPVVQ
jgi:ectoine hydroxylase-related dioxygenase (phytanoyl-CoA dioxygenase family)